MMPNVTSRISEITQQAWLELSDYTTYMSMHPVRSGTAEIRARPTCTSAPRYYLCMCGKSSSTHLLHAVFPLSRQAGREAPLPHGSPATSSRQRRSNHPKHEMMREGWGGIIHATCCWYTTEAPPNPLPLCWTVHAPGGLAQPGGASSAGSRRTVQFLGC